MRKLIEQALTRRLTCLHAVLQIAYPQEQNIHKKLFGGFLMRRAFELAWATAHVHTRCRPWFMALDDITFLTPVEIGSIIKFDSKVVYVPAGALCIVLNVREQPQHHACKDTKRFVIHVVHPF